jgi:hypothetical protein
MTSRGMMADNMFVSQSVLLDWLNNSLQLRLEKIEDVSLEVLFYDVAFLISYA